VPLSDGSLVTSRRYGKIKLTLENRLEVRDTEIGRKRNTQKERETERERVTKDKQSKLSVVCLTFVYIIFPLLSFFLSPFPVSQYIAFVKEARLNESATQLAALL
jgi:hypothetical protein